MIANLQFWSFFSLRSGWFDLLNLFFVIHSQEKQNQNQKQNIGKRKRDQRQAVNELKEEDEEIY